ncbi:MAG: response regulator transcription factor [Anaerovoracaceae bacterium]|jgi:DNA-binding NarL/FixJ family response regulator
MKVLIIDDDSLITMALSTILAADPEVEICGTGNSGAEAIDLYKEKKPDVIIMDIRMKEMDGLTALEEILKEDPDAKVLLLTTFLDDEYIIRAIRLGARGYLLKQDYTALPAAIRAVCSGQTVFGEEVTAKMPDLIAGHSASGFDASDLTERETVLCAYVADGLSNKEIGEKMYLSEGTVRNYLSSVLSKLGLRDRTQLAIYYLTGKK